MSSEDKLYIHYCVRKQHFERMQIGDTIDVKGPLGHFEYTGPGKYAKNRKPKTCKKIAMIAGGTGITPCYQVAQHILEDPEDDTEIALLYANKCEEVSLERFLYSLLLVCVSASS